MDNGASIRCGYLFGDFLLHTVLGFHTIDYNPGWMGPVNELLARYCGCGTVSCAAFIVGGNILGIVLACALYPVTKWIIAKYAASREVKPLL